MNRNQVNALTAVVAIIVVVVLLYVLNAPHVCVLSDACS